MIEIWTHEPCALAKLSFQESELFMVHKGAVLSLDFSKAITGDKLLLASGDALGCLKIWKVQSGKCLREFELGIGAKGGISCLKFT